MSCLCARVILGLFHKFWFGIKRNYSGGTLRTDLEETTNPVKTTVERQIKATIERTHPFVSKQQSISHSESRKVLSTTSGHPECDERADGTSCSAAGSTSTNDDFVQTAPGEGNICILKLGT